MSQPSPSAAADPAQDLRLSQRRLLRHDRRLIRASVLHRGFFYSVIAGTALFAAGAFAAMMGAGNGMMTALHRMTPEQQAWPGAHLPSWTIARTGLGGMLAGFSLMVGFGAAVNAQARRITTLGEARYRMFVAHERLRADFNAQAAHPQAAQYVPPDIRLPQPMTLSMRKISFRQAQAPAPGPRP